MADRIKQCVTPSGVAFSVRSLKGGDQEMLSKVNEDGSGDTSQFNTMLAGALLSLGSKTGSEITENDVKRMLSNDRKFILVVLRMHSLRYQKEFEFKYEWPIQEGQKTRRKVEYVINFDDDNFPVVPYQWMREKIEELLLSGELTEKPDGHQVLFPVMYESYQDMLADHGEITGTFPEAGFDYVWQILTGEQEHKFRNLKQKDIHANTPIMMRSPKTKMFKDAKKGDSSGLVSLPIKDLDIMDVEHLRKQIKDIEGAIDTSLTIQHPDNPLNEKRIDLVSVPAFFFPSQAL